MLGATCTVRLVESARRSFGMSSLTATLSPRILPERETNFSMPCSKIVKVFSIASAYCAPRASTFSFASLAWFTATRQSTRVSLLAFTSTGAGVHRLAVDDQTGNSQTFGLQRGRNTHRLIGVVVNNCRNGDLIADDEEARRLQANDQRLLGSWSTNCQCRTDFRRWRHVQSRTRWSTNPDISLSLSRCRRRLS